MNDAVTTMLLVWNALVMTIDIGYHIFRLYYERKKVKLLEKSINPELII